MDDDRQGPRNRADLEEHAGPLLAVIAVVTVWGLWALGVPTKVNLAVCGVVLAGCFLAVACKYPNALEIKSWARWHAERRAKLDRLD